MAVVTASCAGSSSLFEISFSARTTRVAVALLTDLFLSRFFSADRAVASTVLLLGNSTSLLRTETGFGLASSRGAYNATQALDFGQ